MSKYDIDFDRQAQELLPPDKRMMIFVNFIQAIIKPLKWLHELLFVSYRTGSTADPYAPGTYNKYDQVIYRGKVFESLVNGNTSTPDDTTVWMLVQNNFLGADERVLYNGQVLVLEYALNQWYGTQFRQPPNQSDIYLTMIPKDASVFIIGGDETNSSVSYNFGSREFIVNDYDFDPYYSMIVNIPYSIWEALDNLEANRDRFVRAFVDQYVVAGIIYTINPYT